MPELSAAAESAARQFPAAPVGSPVAPCGGGAEGFSVKVAVAKARRWALGHFTQQNSNSCVIASTRNMIHATTGQNISEEQLQKEMREILGDPDHDFETTPINPAHAEALMQQHGLDTSSQNLVASDALPALVKDGPALVGFKDPGHRVMLDSVTTDAAGNRAYHVRDPDPAYNGRTREMSQADFDAKYNPQAIVITAKKAK